MAKANEKNPFIALVDEQRFTTVDSFEFECGDVATDLPVAYKTWGRLNDSKTNAMVVCHALSGSADVNDWWGALLGPGRALDPERFFIVCINALGSPYGSCSPVTVNPATGKLWGSEFPLATVKDDARIQRTVLENHLGIKGVAVVIGGSMGGMLAQEILLSNPDYVKTGVLLATSATHSAWGISWGEAQRQAIFSDPKFMEGYYDLDDPPVVGLGAARMSALLTYRSRNSFVSKFGRQLPDPKLHKGSESPDPSPEVDGASDRWSVNNHGIKSSTERQAKFRPKSAQTYFTAQSYLRYQAQKFTQRFDANCYIALTRKLDTHDVSRGRADTVDEALALIKQPVLIIGISSDGLFTFSEQEFLQSNIPNSKLIEIESPEGHDAFLLEFSLINDYIQSFLVKEQPELMKNYTKAPIGDAGDSVFGEAEVTTW